MLIEVKDVTKRFGGLVAVNHLDMQVNKGEILGLIGPNGAGKTTFFNVLSGYYKPTTGAIIYRNQNIAGLKPSRIAEMGLVRTYQSAAVFPEMSIMDNLSLANHLTVKPQFIEAVLNSKYYQSKEGKSYLWSRNILKDVGLVDYGNQIAKNLPYGRQKMLGLGMALACKPEILLLDEPATGLNPDENKFMMNLIRVIRDSGVTIVIVEHNMKTIMELSDRVVVLNFGEKIAEGTPKEIMENEKVIAAYLGSKKHVACD